MEKANMPPFLQSPPALKISDRKSFVTCTPPLTKRARRVAAQPRRVSGNLLFLVRLTGVTLRFELVPRMTSWQNTDRISKHEGSR
jgi:hypothetical protein